MSSSPYEQKTFQEQASGDPPTNKFLKLKYSRSQIRELNSVFKCRNHWICVQERIFHLQRCLDNSVLPKNVYEKVKRLRPRFVRSVGRAFVKDEIITEQENLEWAFRSYRNAYRKVAQFLSFMDWIRASRLLGDSGDRLRRRTREENMEKLAWLRNRKCSSIDETNTPVFNLSSLQPTMAQMEVLSCGPRFSIPPVVVCKEDVFNEFEMFSKQMERSLSDSSILVTECS